MKTVFWVIVALIIEFIIMKESNTKWQMVSKNPDVDLTHRVWYIDSVKWDERKIYYTPFTSEHIQMYLWSKQRYKMFIGPGIDYKPVGMMIDEEMYIAPARIPTEIVFPMCTVITVKCFDWPTAVDMVRNLNSFDKVRKY